MFKVLQNKVLWPNKYLGEKSRLLIVFTLIGFILFRAIEYWGAFSTIKVSHFLALYMSLVVRSFLYDKELPIGTISFEFESMNASKQLSRLIITSLSLLIYYFCL